MQLSFKKDPLPGTSNGHQEVNWNVILGLGILLMFIVWALCFRGTGRKEKAQSTVELQNELNEARAAAEAAQKELKAVVSASKAAEANAQAQAKFNQMTAASQAQKAVMGIAADAQSQIAVAATRVLAESKAAAEAKAAAVAAEARALAESKAAAEAKAAAAVSDARALAESKAAAEAKAALNSQTQVAATATSQKEAAENELKRNTAIQQLAVKGVYGIAGALSGEQPSVPPTALDNPVAESAIEMLATAAVGLFTPVFSSNSNSTKK